MANAVHLCFVCFSTALLNKAMSASSHLFPSFVAVKLTENGKETFPFELNEMFSLSQNKKKKKKKSLFVCLFIDLAKSPKHLNSGSDHSYYNVLSFSCSSVEQQQ